MQLKSEFYKNFHLFGEMDLNLFDTPKNIYKRACEISEDCGYLTTATKMKSDPLLEKMAIEQNEEFPTLKIEIVGEDCPDTLDCINVLYCSNSGVQTIQKEIFKTEWFNKYEGQNVEPHMDNKMTLTQVIRWVDGNWLEIFNLKEHNENLKRDPLYQTALLREGRTNDPNYTGFTGN